MSERSISYLQSFRVMVDADEEGGRDWESLGNFMLEAKMAESKPVKVQKGHSLTVGLP